MLDYFRHPFLPRKDGRRHTTQELFRVYEDARTAQKLCDILQPLVVRRKGDVDYLRYCARMHEHYVSSQRLVADLNAFDPKGFSERDVAAAQAKFLERIISVRDQTASLRDTFNELWLRTNQTANLHYAIDEYDALVKVWDDAAARAKDGKFAFDPRPPAEWIYHPDAFKGQTVQQAYFRKVLKLDPAQVAAAGIQVQGDTHVKIYVNGKQVGEQFARRNLSAPVNPKLLAVYDIKPLLRAGDNVIAIDAHNYGTTQAELEPGGPPRSAGLHLYGEIRDASGNVQPIASGGSWKVSTSDDKGWNSPGFDDGNWQSAQGDPKPTVWVTYPDFTKGLRGFSNVR
jgi:hypothetical protein